MSTLYLVVRLTWTGREYGFDPLEFAPGGGMTVASFRTRTEADEHCRRLTQQARDEVASPFLLAEDLHNFTDADDTTFCQHLCQFGLTPPEKTLIDYVFSMSAYRDWPAWYDRIVDTLTAEQRTRIWDLLNLVFYRVQEIELDEEP
jgi:hypothetical protein